MSSKAKAGASSQKNTKPTPVHKGKGKGKAVPAPAEIQRPPTPDTSGSPEQQQIHDDEAADDSSDASDSVQVASSRTPRTRRPSVKPKLDKGKQRAVSQDQQVDADEFVAPKSRLPRKKAPLKRDVFDSEPKASTSQPRRSPKVLTNSKIPKQSSQSLAARPGPSKIPIKTSAKETAPSSSAVRSRSRSRARTFSVMPENGEVWSAIKPVPLKTVFRSSPPRVIKISDSASSASGSDDEFLLRASRSSNTSFSSQKNRKRRKPNAGEFEWDEKSRSCIVKRERSRSRSVAVRLAVKTEGASVTANNEYSQMPQSDEDESGLGEQSQMDVDGVPTFGSNSNILDGLNDDSDMEQAHEFHDNHIDDGAFDQNLPLGEERHGELEEAALPVYDFTNGGDASSSIAGSDSESEDDAFERSVQQIPREEAHADQSMRVDSKESSHSQLDHGVEERPIIKEEVDVLGDDDSFLSIPEDFHHYQAAHQASMDKRHIVPHPESADLAHNTAPLAHVSARLEENLRTESMRGSKLERRSTSPLPPSSPPPLPASRESTAPRESAMQESVEDESEGFPNQSQKSTFGHLQLELITAVQSTPRTSLPTKRLQVAVELAMPGQIDASTLPATEKEAPTLVVAPSSSPQTSHIPAEAPQASSRTRALTPTLRISDAISASSMETGPILSGTRERGPARSEHENPRRLSPGPDLREMAASPSQKRASPLAKLEGLLSPKASVRRSLSRSPSPLAQVSCASIDPHHRREVVSGPYRSPRAPNLSTSPQPAPAASVRKLMPMSPTLQSSANLFSTPARLRSARSISPLPSNKAMPPQPHASLLQMLRTAAVTSSTKQKDAIELQPALSPSLNSGKEHREASQDAVTSLLQRIEHHRRSISVEVSEPADVSSTHQDKQGASNVIRTSPAMPVDEVGLLPATTSEPNLRQSSPSPAAHPVAVPATPKQETASRRMSAGISTPATKAGAQAKTPCSGLQGTLQSPAHIGSSAAASVQKEHRQPATTTTPRMTPNALSAGKSPALQRALAPLDGPQLSPNVTVRRGRSASYSSASTMSVRSKPNTPREQLVRGRKLSFTELGSFDSSPLSVAASIGCHSFEALDGNSDDEDASGNIVRPSPSKELAQQQKQAIARFDGTLSSSSSEESEEEGCDSDDEISSMLAHQTSRQVSQGVETVSSTPAKKMMAMAIANSTSSPALEPPATSTPGRANVLKSPTDKASDPLPDSESPELASEDETDLHENSMFVEAGSFAGSEGGDLPSLIVEGCSSEADVLSMSRTDQSIEGDSSNMSIVLDVARPRSELVPPPLTRHSRPAPHRRKSRLASNQDTSDTESVQAESTSIQVSPPARQRARSGSAFSRAGSAVSNTSTVVQVSSNDPKAAARAAAILKIHHKYIQEGNWQSRSPDLGEHAGNSPEGERVLDELLKEAELEVSMYTEAFDTTSQADISVESEEAKPNQSLLPSRSVKHGSHRLAVWTRHDWRNLEQCFIDERRRTKIARVDFDANDVVKIFLENERLALKNCVGEWDTGKILLRVEALQARKAQKQEEEASQRARSTSFVSSVWSRAPSEFLSQEDSRIGAGNQSSSTEEGSFLQIPGGLAATGRRYARSAEPQGKIYAERDGYSHLSSRHPSTSMRDGVHRRAASLTDVEAMPQLRKVQPLSSRVSKLYPPLDELAAEMRYKKAMPIKGRSVLAAVNMFEKIEEEQSLEAVKSRVPKRKDISDTASESGSVKRVRM